MHRDDDDVNSKDDSNDEENNCEAAKTSGDEIESVGTTGVPETTKNHGEIESVGTTGVPEKSIENGGTTGVPEKTVENGGITKVPEKTIKDGGEIPALMAREEVIVDNNVDRNAGTTSEMVSEQEALDTNGHGATTGDAAQHGLTAPATLGTMVLSGFMAPMTFGAELGSNEVACNDESGGNEVTRNDEMGGSTVARGYNAQRVVVEHKADGGKAMKDGAMKAMNNIPKYEGSGNEVMNDAPINKQHDDSKQDGCTRASKDEFSIAGVIGSWLNGNVHNGEVI
jgi:hypothetical protein